MNSITQLDDTSHLLLRSNSSRHHRNCCDDRRGPPDPQGPQGLQGPPGTFNPQYGSFATASTAIIQPAPSTGVGITSIPFSAGPMTNRIELVSDDTVNPAETAIRIELPGDYQVEFGAGTSTTPPQQIGLSINNLPPLPSSLLTIGDFSNISTIISLSAEDVPALLKVVNSGQAAFQLGSDIGNSVTAYLIVQRLSTASTND